MVTDSVNTVNILEKSNMLLFSKELNGKDGHLKSQILISTKDDKTTSECFWTKYGFFRYVKSDFNIYKISFTEKALIYINQAQLTTKTTNNLLQLCHLGTEDLDNCVCKEN